VLGGDARQLERQFGQRSEIAYNDPAGGVHRLFVRAVFALIEAVVEQHKLLLLDLDENGAISLGNEVTQVLSEKKGYLPLRRKIEAVYRAAADAFGQPVDVQGDRHSWQTFMSAIEVRNRITHPKSVQQCQVRWEDLDIVRDSENWFRSNLHRELVLAVDHHRALPKNW
jgi:hypothetical protein